MLLVVGLVLDGKAKDRSAHLGRGQLVGCKAISPDAPMLEEKSSVQNLDVVELVLVGHALERSHFAHPPYPLARCTCRRPIRWADGYPEGEQNLRSCSGAGKVLGRFRFRRAAVPAGISALPPVVPPGAGWRRLCR